MNALDLLNGYLRELERRLRVSAVLKGLAVMGVVALAATLALVLFTNAFAFSASAVIGARVVLFLAIAFALGFGLLLPLMRLNRRRAASRAEQEFPQFEERLLTFAEARKTGTSEAFLELLADDALPVTRAAEPARVVPRGRLAAFLGAAAATIGVLLWLTAAGPGFLGYGSSLLWAGTPRGGDAPFYAIDVFPGNKTVRRGGDQLITAHLIGFQTDRVRLFARYESTSRWEEVPMQPQPGDVGFEFLFAGLPEPVDYYVEAGAVSTDKFRLGVVDLPKVKRIQVTYHYPAWLRRNDETEKDGGDLHAVVGTEAELLIETDKPLNSGRLVLDDGTEVTLDQQGGTLARGTVTINNDGLYHVAVREQDEMVRVTEDYFIEAQQESKPTIRVRRPGRDYRASPIEEVTIAVEAEDDFGLQEVSLRYSVNGGPEQTMPLLEHRGVTKADGSKILYLEDHHLVPGDLVSFYGVARDARSTSRTNMFFIEAQPFEREYSQSQRSGGMGGGGAQDQNRISPRQKEIISATWNIINDEARGRDQVTEDGKFLSDVQATLKEQAESLAKRMKARELAGANEEFKSFSENMEAAAGAMGEAVDKLSARQWRDALVPEQKALQHLLRAESVFRKIQVARGNQGGGGGGNMGRDLENLFDLELDTEKNQYETGQQAASMDQRAQEVDEALQKLAELARRQQELAEQKKRNEQSFQQRWQQEMLRREAEELKKEIERLARQQQQQGRQSQSARQGQQGQQRQQGQRMQRGMTGSGQQGGFNQVSEQRLEQALEQLKQATEDMRRASSSNRSPSARDAESLRAAERLQEATELMSRLRREEATDQLSGIAESAERLAEQQREFARKLRELYKGHRAITGQRTLEEPEPPDPGKVMEMAEEKQEMSEQLDRLESDMQRAVRDLAATQKSASSKLRDALGEAQQRELGLRMKYLSEWIRRGLGAYAWLREAPVTEGLDRLAEQTRQAQQALGQGSHQREGLESALSRVERLRSELERMARGMQPGRQQQGARQQGQPGQQQSQSGQMSRQGGQQQGQGMRGPQATPSGQPRGAAGGPSRAFSAMNRGDRRFPAGNAPRVSPEQFRAMERAYNEGLRDLSQLRRETRDNNEVSRDINDLIREMQRLDPSKFPGNPELVEQLRTQVLPGLEQVELRLRRELEGSAEGQVKSVLSRPIPPGYAEAVAEYYRQLSRGK